MITCRRATPDDLSLFREIRVQALQESPEAFGSTYASALARDTASWQEQLDATVSGDTRDTQFAFDGSNCAGIAALYREPDAPHGDLLMMWVPPAYRGTEAAPTLINALIAWAKEIGLSSVYLNVTDANHRAIRFYERCGFIATGETVDVDSERHLRGIRMLHPLNTSS